MPEILTHRILLETRCHCYQQVNIKFEAPPPHTHMYWEVHMFTPATSFNFGPTDPIATGELISTERRRFGYQGKYNRTETISEDRYGKKKTHILVEWIYKEES